MQTNPKKLSERAVLWYSLAAIASFHLAYMIGGCQILLLVFLYSLFQLVNVRTGRQAFYLGLGIGLAIYSPHLTFFWEIFQMAAIPLWIILSCWLGLFFILGRMCLIRFGSIGWACAAPFVWMGLEYFRSELYYLRFSWLNIGYAFSYSSVLHYFAWYGVYGIGFAFMALAAFLGVVQQKGRLGKVFAGMFLLALVVFPVLLPASEKFDQKTLRVTGVQLEFPSPAEAISGLNQALKKYPDTDLFVLSEYSFMGPIPNLVKKWCRTNHKYLVAGGEDPTSPIQYYNTAFVTDPAGEIVFRQAKSVPVQFMKDGLPAASQGVWNSPWGKLGFGICYDASYTRVTDRLIRAGAQALIFPTMDTQDWGGYEHRMHGRIAPMRAAEYAVPVFRLCSSGISQLAAPTGKVVASAPFPGQEAVMSAQLQLASGGRIPLDRGLALLSVGITGILAAWFGIENTLQRRRSKIATP